MRYRLTRAVGGYRLNRAARGILATMPLKMAASDLRFVTMLQHRDVLPYLLAIKSLYPRFAHGSAMVLDDGTLTEEDRSLLRHHVPLIEIRHIEAVLSRACPGAALGSASAQ